jgi:hypothetical protein
VSDLRSERSYCVPLLLSDRKLLLQRMLRLFHRARDAYVPVYRALEYEDRRRHPHHCLLANGARRERGGIAMTHGGTSSAPATSRGALVYRGGDVYEPIATA